MDLDLDLEEWIWSPDAAVAYMTSKILQGQK